MGISNLLQFLKPIIKNSHISKYKNEVVGVDIMCWIHRGLISCAYDIVTDQYNDSYLNFIEKMLIPIYNHNIKVVFVFDGEELPEKKKENMIRKNRREKAKMELQEIISKVKNPRTNEMVLKKCIQAISVSKEIIDSVKEFCRKKNIDYIISPYEADAQLSYLCRMGFISCAISEDSDLLVYGCPRVLYKLKNTGECNEISLMPINDLIDWNIINKIKNPLSNSYNEFYITPIKKLQNSDDYDSDISLDEETSVECIMNDPYVQNDNEFINISRKTKSIVNCNNNNKKKKKKKNKNKKKTNKKKNMQKSKCDNIIKQYIQRFDWPEELFKLQYFNIDMFLTMCVLSGCDYSNDFHITGMGIKTAYNLIFQHKNIENIFHFLISNDRWRNKIPENLNTFDKLMNTFQKIKNAFLNHQVYDFILRKNIPINESFKSSFVNKNSHFIIQQITDASLLYDPLLKIDNCLNIYPQINDIPLSSPQIRDDDYNKNDDTHNEGGHNIKINHDTHNEGGHNIKINHDTHNKGGHNIKINRDTHNEAGDNIEINHDTHNKGGHNIKINDDTHNKGGDNIKINDDTHNKGGDNIKINHDTHNKGDDNFNINSVNCSFYNNHHMYTQSSKSTSFENIFKDFTSECFEYLEISPPSFIDPQNNNIPNNSKSEYFHNIITQEQVIQQTDVCRPLLHKDTNISNEINDEYHHLISDVTYNEYKNKTIENCNERINKRKTDDYIPSFNLKKKMKTASVHTSSSNSQDNLTIQHIEALDCNNQNVNDNEEKKNIYENSCSYDKTFNSERLNIFSMYDNNYQMWEKKDDLLKKNYNSFHANNIMETYNDHYINKTYDEHGNNKVNINICDDISTTNNDHNEEMLDEKKEFAEIKSAKNIYENMRKNFFLFKTLNEDINTPIKCLNVKGKMNVQDNCEQDDKVANLKSDKMTEEQNEKCDNILNEKCDNILNEKCNNILNEKCNNILNEKCNNILNEKCDNILNEKCNNILNEKCNNILNEKCDNILNQKCDNILNEKCDNILNEKCDNVLNNTPNLITNCIQNKMTTLLQITEENFFNDQNKNDTSFNKDFHTNKTYLNKKPTEINFPINEKKKNDLLRNPLEESRKSSLISYKNKTPSKNINSKSQLRITSFFKRIDKKTNENHNMHSTQKIFNEHNNNNLNDNIQNDKFYNNVFMNSPINYSVEYSEEDYINSFNDNYSDMKSFQKLKKKTKRNIKNTPQSYSIKDHFAVSLQSQDKNDKLSFTNYNSLEKDIFLNQSEKELQSKHNSINKEKNQNNHLQISSLTNDDNITMNNHTSNLNTQQNEQQSSNNNTIIIHSNNHQPNFSNENVISNNVFTEQDTYNKHITVLKSTDKVQNQSIEKNKETSQKINVEYILQNLNYNYQPKNQKINTFDYFKEKENVNHCNPYIDHNL
ncbi:exonuclease I, putative [Plasmodium reichenowi]|uniref:Exonuclease 1 n=1 Tax=Plasmodium reichenowi TaxID=5854 RepID=A0A060RW61_PLARE|nr:exonuclease I, putative [Plasmodium reichenowi]